MKKLSFITLFITAIVVIVSCSDVKRTPGHDYMPDMRYSRAYETYTPHDNLKANGINYTGMPVAGTVQRGQAIPFQIAKDKEGDSTNYVAARGVTNPLPAPTADQMKEAERLYLINCGICHGTNLDGNGPLYNGGNGPYPAAPRNLVSDAHVLSMADGQLMYSITYGKGSMGPYGPQLTTSQRWMIIHYLKEKQGRGAGGATASSGGAKPTVTATGEASGGARGDSATSR